MEKYIVVDGNYEEKINTQFEYSVGETIRYNSESQIKCVGIEIVGEEINYIFKEGKQVFIY